MTNQPLGVDFSDFDEFFGEATVHKEVKKVEKSKPAIKAVQPVKEDNATVNTQPVNAQIGRAHV